jgi:hypothetical protein
LSSGAPTKFCQQTGGYNRECDVCDAFNPEKEKKIILQSKNYN